MKLHYLQHVPYEGLGMIADWARERGIEVSATRLFDGEPLPQLGASDLVVVMGGPMSVNDTAEYPWLKAEMAFISRVLESGKPALGICLGAQLFATVLGASVTRNRVKEIGWFPIFLSEEPGANPLRPLVEACGEHPTVFHWHGDTFGIPEGAKLLAGSAACDHQAFVAGKDGQILGLQFHLETTPECVRGLIANADDDALPQARFIQPPQTMQSQTEEHSAALQPALFRILDHWANVPARTVVAPQTIG